MVCGLLLGLIVAGGARAEEVPFAEAFDPAWSQDGIWDDGKAEVATYDAVRTIYGQGWQHEETRILVSEPMRVDQHVKAEHPYAGKTTHPVLKYHVVSRLQTTNYPYQLSMSLFLDRAVSWRPIKAVYSSQEWCGITHKDFAFWERPPQFVADSYWEDEATTFGKLADWEEGCLLEDQLAVSLRGLKLSVGDFVSVRVLPSQVGNRLSVPRPWPVTIWRETAAEPFLIGTERYEAAAQIVFRAKDAAPTENDPFVGRFVFAAEPPHLLLRYEMRRGHSGELKSVRRWAYWER
jgi:hypothetical protein